MNRIKQHFRICMSSTCMFSRVWHSECMPTTILRWTVDNDWREQLYRTQPTGRVSDNIAAVRNLFGFRMLLLLSSQYIPILIVCTGGRTRKPKWKHSIPIGRAGTSPLCRIINFQFQFLLCCAILFNGSACNGCWVVRKLSTHGLRCWSHKDPTSM